MSRFTLLFTLLMFPVSLIAQPQASGALGTERPKLLASDMLEQGGGVAASGVTAPVRLDPFGANLFQGGFGGDREDGLNPGYLLQPGDSLSIRIWGATEFNSSLTIDPQGNVFIPTVGPVPVGGVRNDQLNQRVTAAVSTVYTDNVRVYTSLDGSQPVAVFVTGYVLSPGRFSGIPSNSILHFLDRAGGIDAQRGSYRDVLVKRNGKLLREVDLYSFLLDGKLEQIQFQDGDTIVVGPRGPSIAVSGDVGNAALLELTEGESTGADIVAKAMLKPGSSHVGFSGTREGKPFSMYVKLAEFLMLGLQDGDTVLFQIDQHDEVIVVDVEGSHLGPSRYAVPLNTRLQELLDFIEVDLRMADIDSVSLKRRSVALRQEMALRESLQRLKARYLTASSQTDQEAAIRAQEAKLIGEFVENASSVEPNGRLVVARNSRIANVRLQTGDTVTIPERSDAILLSGEVLVTQAILYESGLRAQEYIARSGGFTKQAETDYLILVHANGEVTRGSNPLVRSGDEIIVMPKVPTKNLQLAATVIDIMYKIAIAASVAVSL